MARKIAASAREPRAGRDEPWGVETRDAAACDMRGYYHDGGREALDTAAAHVF